MNTAFCLTDLDLRELKFAEVTDSLEQACNGDASLARMQNHLADCPACQKQFNSITDEEVAGMRAYSELFEALTQPKNDRPDPPK